MQNYIDKELIQEYFSDYKSYMIWIMIGFSIVSTLIQYFQNLSLSRKVESYKNDLKKDEIKFSRFNELQIESLKILYDHVVTFHFRFNNLINPVFYTHSSLIKNLNNLKLQHNICMEYFHRNKIFLTDNLLNKIKDIEANFKPIKKYLDDEKQSISELEEYHMSNDVQVIYGTAENEVTSIKKRLDGMKAYDGFLSYEQDIKDVRNLVEAYFKQLTA